jgi:hypothetical protein
MARTLRSFLVVVLLAVGSIHGSVAAAAATAGGQVEVGSFAKVGRFGTAIVTVRATCRDAVVADLVIDVEQGTRSGTLTGTQGLTCDGRWHRLRPEVSARLVDPAVDGPFEPGPARVDARLSLLDPETFDPLPQAFDSEIVTLLAPVEVRIGWQVKLNAGGSASVPVKARCQRPWVEPGLSVEVSQSDGTTGGSASGDFGLVCDAQWHAFRVRVIPSSPFAVGTVHVLAYLTVYDPLSFDPVDQANASVDRQITHWS